MTLRTIAAIAFALASSMLQAQSNKGMSSAESAMESIKRDGGIREASVAELMNAALAMDPELDLDAYAEDYLRIFKPQRYASSMHSPERLSAEVAKVRAELEQRRAAFDRRALYEVRSEAVVERVDGNEVLLASPFANGLFTVATDYGRTTRYIPPHLDLFIANAERLRTWSLDRRWAGHFAAERAKNERPVVTLVARFELVRLNQHRHFQAVLREAEMYSDFIRSEKITAIRDRRPAAELLKQRWLNEGVTLDVIPEHGFVVEAHRPLELLIQDEMSLYQCRDVERLHGHRSILCERNYDIAPGATVRVAHLFAGGRLVRTDFYGTGSPPPAETLTHAWFNAHIDRAPNEPPPAGEAFWQRACCSFRFDSRPYLAGSGERPFHSVISQVYDRLVAGDPELKVVP